jgi:bifunctional DNA-binding transcriptional regulator/antitoxin component of YhaV-PrlF toxin-antitoxin module
MFEAKLSSKNQIVIPLGARRPLGIKPADKLLGVVRNDMIVLMRKPKNYSDSFAQPRLPIWRRPIHLLYKSISHTIAKLSDSAIPANGAGPFPIVKHRLKIANVIGKLSALALIKDFMNCALATARRHSSMCHRNKYSRRNENSRVIYSLDSRKALL